MTPEQRTKAAAQKCADLANFEAKDVWRSEHHTPESFTSDYPLTVSVAFRRYVERIDARDREVLALLDALTGWRGTEAAKILRAANLLRADLLPEPKPTLYCSPEVLDAIATAFDWIAKRGVEVKP